VAQLAAVHVMSRVRLSGGGRGGYSGAIECLYTTDFSLTIMTIYYLPNALPALDRL